MDKEELEVVSELTVDFIDKMGTDLTIVNAARVSFGGHKTDLDEKDKKLIKYLAEHEHMSPFEHCTLTVKISCPLYIRSQIHRHRTFAYNEISRRYTSQNLQIYCPPIDDIRTQAKNNRQASDAAMEAQAAFTMMASIQKIYAESFDAYTRLLEAGVSREQARGILPQNVMTEFYMTGNLRNFVHFLKLRLHEGAQKEAQYVALKIKAILEEHYPIAMETLMK